MVMGDDDRVRTHSIIARLRQLHDVYADLTLQDLTRDLSTTPAVPYKSNGQMVISQPRVVAAVEAENARRNVTFDLHLTEAKARRKSPSWREIVPSAEGYVYFIQAHHEEVKIGFSDEPYRRRGQLQTAQAYQLRMLALCPGPQGRETAFHDMLAPHRLAGEWFEWCPEVQAVVKTVQMLTGFSGDGQLW